jgi:hypothetical protein
VEKKDMRSWVVMKPILTELSETWVKRYQVDADSLRGALMLESMDPPLPKPPPQAELDLWQEGVKSYVQRDESVNQLQEAMDRNLQHNEQVAANIVVSELQKSPMFKRLYRMETPARSLGQGAHAVVLAGWKRGGRRPVAVKIGYDMYTEYQLWQRMDRATLSPYFLFPYHTWQADEVLPGMYVLVFPQAKEVEFNDMSCEDLLRLTEGLHALHAANIVFYDVSPSNIMRGMDGLVYWIDVGNAEVHQDNMWYKTKSERQRMVVAGTQPYPSWKVETRKEDAKMDENKLYQVRAVSFMDDWESFWYLCWKVIHQSDLPWEHTKIARDRTRMKKEFVNHVPPDIQRLIRIGRDTPDRFQDHELTDLIASVKGWWKSK